MNDDQKLSENDEKVRREANPEISEEEFEGQMEIAR
jgi:hypothetical protein